MDKMKTIVLDELIIKKPEPEDVEKMAELEKRCFSDPWSWEMLYSDAITNDISTYLLAYEGDTLLGYIGIWAVGYECQINNVAVNPDYRRMGIGTLLLTSILTATAMAGMNYWTLEVRESNLAAIEMYKSAGFVIDGVRPKYYEDGENALLMSKSEGKGNRR